MSKHIATAICSLITLLIVRPPVPFMDVLGPKMARDAKRRACQEVDLPGRVVGTVLDSEGAPMPNAQIVADAATSPFSCHVRTGEDGRFEMPLPVGITELRAGPTRVARLFHEGVETTVQVDGGDPTEIDALVLPPLSSREALRRNYELIR